jgi:DNA-binding IclR family transcriptional regulator
MTPTLPRCLAVLSLFALASLAVAATTYRWVDSQGVVHYSDTPHPGAQEIQLTGAQTYHGTASPAAVAPPAADKQASAAAYQSCAITQPAPDTALYAPETINVSVRSTPTLRPGDQIEAQLDGAPLQSIGDGLSFQIQQPERGTHAISAVVRDANGTVVCSATPVSFSVQLPSINSPASPVKPH